MRTRASGARRAHPQASVLRNQNHHVGTLVEADLVAIEQPRSSTGTIRATLQRGHAQNRTRTGRRPVPRNPNDLEIRAFWSWFASIAAELAADLETSRLLDGLDAGVSG